MSKEQSAALAVIKDFGMPVVSEQYAAGYEEEMDGLTFQFNRVKVPSGGGIIWEIPNDDDPDNPFTEKELRGVIVDHHPINAFWQAEYDGQKNPPDCASMDGKFGINRETGEKHTCQDCPMNQWGTDPKGNGGKACKNMRRVYLMQPGNMFPLLLVVPPTSLRDFADFIAKRIVGKGRRSYDVVTKITLKKEKNKGGIDYSQCVFGIAGILDDETRKQASEYSKMIKAQTRTIDITADEYYTEGGGNGQAAQTQDDAANQVSDEEMPF